MLGRRTFALVERSLRVETRLARTHIVRLVFAGLILFYLGRVQSDLHSYSTPGRDVFQGICWLNFFLLNLAGVSLFATVITEEKEEMTLGLLRMAGISPVGILLGKVTPRLITALLLLSIQLPFTFLAITLGGVTMHQVLSACLALMSFTVALSGFGALLSTVCQRSTVASTLMTASLAVFYLIPWLIPEAVEGMGKRRWVAPETVLAVDRAMLTFQQVSTYEAVNRILVTNYAGAMANVHFVVNSAFGLLSFLLAWALFDPCTRNEKPVAPARGLMGLFSKRLAAQSGNRAWNQALAWKDFYFITGGMAAAIIKFVCYALLMAGMCALLARNLRSEVRDNVGATIMMSMLTALAVEIPIYMSRVFSEELRWQTWSGLFLLPETTGRIAWQKVRGVLPTFLPAVLLFVIGAFVSPGFLADLLEESFLSFEGWYVISQYILCIHVVVMMSLTVKWGALPLGVAIVVIGNLMLTQCFRGMDHRMLLVPILTGFVLCGLLQALTVDRLKRLAAQ